MQNESRLIHVTGTVQGVGFRPFIYRLAKTHGLFGYVKNLGNRVEITVEGKPESLDTFLSEIPIKNPPLSRVSGLQVKTVPVRGYTEFLIMHSENGVKEDSIIPPDTAICGQCLSEMFDPKNRHYHYPFTVCTNCGPRYTTVRALPYDRDNTSMVDFPLCRECESEYTNPFDRRYHAQPACCPECGPRLWLSDSSGKVLGENYEAIRQASKLLDSGFIFSIKGFGGFHLACSAKREEAVEELRRRLKRPQQPFAVMAKNVDLVRSFAEVEGQDLELLTSPRRPIVVLPKKENFPLAFSLSPGLHNIGVMLPYTGTQHLLFDCSPDSVYIMTSANLPGRPMVTENGEAFEKLAGIADYHLLHNRVVVNRTDDTVMRTVAGKKAFIRRSRGFVPEPLELPFEIGAAIGVGAELNTTVTVAKGKRAYLSQYVGNTGHVETFRYHQEVVSHLFRLTGITPGNWGCDLHPSFNTTRFAKIEGKEHARFVQHHQAHLLSLMADNLLPEDARIIGIALDGVGLGNDGTVWGGEIFESGYLGFERLSHLKPQPMPGGDLAAIFPSRMVLGILNGLLSVPELRKLPLYFQHGEPEFTTTLKQLDQGLNVVLSTSTGRVLDSAAALLGICSRRTYEGEPAMKLEAAALKSTRSVDLPLKKAGHVLDTSELLYGLYELAGQYSAFDLAYAVEDTLALGISELAVSFAKKRGIDRVGLSGGVACNDHITSRIAKTVTDAGLEFLTHNNVPCGDGGVSFGQAVFSGLVGNSEE